MIALLVHAILGLVAIGTLIRLNRSTFRRPTDGPRVSVMEALYGAIGVVSVVLGWYFNVRFVQHYGGRNPIWGDGASWTHYVSLMFTNDAARSASQDYTIANVVILPLWTIIDGRRRGISSPWLYFVISLFTSFAFAVCAYLFTLERLDRHHKASSTSEPAAAAG
ncbi:DUF2834 domain-containing protein [Nocardia sp. NBC_00565]|uniref:DUF2834 domain-containing protein n=1 Tax=Nocardia sp. NBC_00565 TaxID=2975993 RepID=UPI002E8172E8|nr:DUF2834 domain-containing protein [Nocardia sp. NBC_00565]WUC06435.1 DUF2834 domain-containing protein [Nocardia sp. NBC_00565]